MPIGIYEKDDIDAVANTIRNNLGNDTKYTVKQMPIAINEIQTYAYNSGHSEGYGEGRDDGYSMGREDGITVGKAEGIEEGKAIGYAEGKTDGIAEGKKSQYDEFWDNYQRTINGVSNVYSAQYMFASGSWNDETFKPKYSMTYMIGANNMFNSCEVTDLNAALERQGVVFDFHKVASFGGTFSYMSTTTLPVIDTRGSNTLSNVFSLMFSNSKKLRTIEKLILKDDGSQPFLNSFNYCESLENIVVEGVIGQDGLNLQWSTKLTHDSLMSIIEHLSSTASGKTATFSKIAVNNAFETSEGLADGSTSEEWLNLIATKNNWTISLV